MLQRRLQNLENLYDMKKHKNKIADRAFDDMAEIYKYISNNLGLTETLYDNPIELLTLLKS